MSDLQWLLVVLAVLYGCECTCWIRRGSVVFSSWLGHSWRERHPGALLGNQHGGFILAAPLPPLGVLLTTSQFPLSLSPEGVLGYVASNVNPGWRPAQTDRFFRFDQIGDISARGKHLLVNGEILLSAPSTGVVRHIARELRRLVKLPLSQRAPVITELVQATLNGSTIKQRWLELQKHSRPVRLFANVLFLYLFVFAPAWIWHLGFKLGWLGLLAGLVTLTTGTAVFFYRAHRRLYPQAEEERFTHTLTIALAPTATMRAHDALSRPLFEAFHPLAVAEKFLPKADFQELARRVLLDLRHPAEPVCPNADPAARATELHARMALRTEVENLLKQSGVELDLLVKPPTPLDESCHAYCPRCGAQFTKADGACADCGGLALAAFGPAK